MQESLRAFDGCWHFLAVSRQSILRFLAFNSLCDYYSPQFSFLPMFCSSLLFWLLFDVGRTLFRNSPSPTLGSRGEHSSTPPQQFFGMLPTKILKQPHWIPRKSQTPRLKRLRACRKARTKLESSWKGQAYYQLPMMQPGVVTSAFGGQHRQVQNIVLAPQTRLSAGIYLLVLPLTSCLLLSHLLENTLTLQSITSPRDQRRPVTNDETNSTENTLLQL